MEAQTKVRITIWQPYFLGCMLALGQIDAVELDVLESDTELQREVFTWPVQEDVWAGIVDDEVRSTLQERFVTDFQPVKLPEQRSMASFTDFVDRIGAVVTAGGSEWSVGASGVADRSTSASCMTNSLLAFHQQLEWLLDMFRDVPGASVSVR